MKTVILSLAACALLLAGNGKGNGYQNGASTNALTLMPAYSVSDTQKADMLFMIEEEKMAQEVYLKMYELWGAAIFQNIANSEQSHQNSVKALLDKYGITAPSNSVGVFQNSDIQALYNTLVAKGSVSLNDALQAGIDIEKTDIADLESRITSANPDAKTVYENLPNGSYNHLASFEALKDGNTTTTTAPNPNCNTTAMQKANGNGWHLVGTSTSGCSVTGLKQAGAKKVYRYGGGIWSEDGEIGAGEGFWLYK